ncbi:choice-of-anchor P family protein [Nocardioides donggukensis]|uniref:Uncharacterized protein n=1 Tax=Nocardioides donggukensis TaxID=2774019 RepID=A0A927Q279_9ACTN|nr:choice-of-anchor P family protein [Nocardioides donggukensis]MBD8870119.1 hypothetical protein [Nocardioides donggukensis]
MRNSIRRLVAVHTAGATVLAGAVALAGGTAAPALAGTVTDYGFSARAFGSVANFEEAGVSSQRTAYSFLGCTRETGVTKTETVAETGGSLGAALHVAGVENRTRTLRNPRTGRVGSRATSRVSEVVLGDPDGVNITIRALRTRADAWAMPNGTLHASSRFASAGIGSATDTDLDEVLNGVGATLQDLLDEVAAAPGGVLEVPSLGEIALGNDKNRVFARSAKAGAVALRVTLFGEDLAKGGGDDIETKIGRARAFVYRNLPAGVMRGTAWPVDAKLVGEVLNVGRVVPLQLPCNGTRGNVRQASVADVDLGNAGVVQVDAPTSRVFGIQREDGRARAWTEGRLASLNVGGEDGLTIRGVVGRANVTQDRRGRITRRSMTGTTIGSVTVGGEEQSVPGPGEAETFATPDGQVTIEPYLREGGKRGLRVTALRVTIVDDSPGDTVINLGVARAYLKRT